MAAITALTAGKRDPNRVNVFVDGVFKFSLALNQVVDLGIKVGNNYTDEGLQQLLNESSFGKLYGRALEYCFMRPHSQKEMKDYLWRKTRPVRLQDGSERPGVSQDVADRVLERLLEKGYINDTTFALNWVESRSLSKGVSKRKLVAELRVKGVAQPLIEQAFATTERNDLQELAKIILKRRSRYQDDQKFMAYLARQGFSYEDIKQALAGGQ